MFISYGNETTTSFSSETYYNEGCHPLYRDGPMTNTREFYIACEMGIRIR